MPPFGVKRQTCHRDFTDLTSHRGERTDGSRFGARRTPWPTIRFRCAGTPLILNRTSDKEVGLLRFTVSRVVVMHIGHELGSCAKPMRNARPRFDRPIRSSPRMCVCHGSTGCVSSLLPATHGAMGPEKDPHCMPWLSKKCGRRLSEDALHQTERAAPWS